MSAVSRILRHSLAVPLLLAPLAGQDASAVQPDSRTDLAVLYVGAESGERTESFVRLLREHFEDVGTAVYPEFRAEQADPYDVVILDQHMQPSERSIGIGPQPKLPADYARATVLVNGPGVLVADRQLKSKIGWY